MEGQYSITIVPAMEAEFPGGFKQISTYLNDNFFNKITQKGNTDKIRQTSLKFTINEEGKVVNSKIFNTSSDVKIDQLLLEAINKMPKWKPAKNSKGIKVKQEFMIPFGGGGC
jgi:TonB family protein